MGEIRIKTINRNLGAISQQYRIEYRKQGDPDWISFATLNYVQAGTILPLYIPVPNDWLTFNAEVRIVTICGTSEVNGVSIFVPIEEKDCTGGTTLPQDIDTFYYGFTELDTTGDLKPEVEYIESVTDVFTNNNEKSDVYTPSTNVQIASFDNAEDKVLFFQIPPTEPAFTKWSEVGNPFQQNQDIDPDYGADTNLWFKAIRSGQTVYLTRYQTKFAGNVLFSR